MRSSASQLLDWHLFVPSARWAAILLVAAALLGVFGLGTAAHTYFLRGRKPAVSLRGATKGLLSLVWILPVIGVFAFFGLSHGPMRFQLPHQPRAGSAVVATGQPSALRVEVSSDDRNGTPVVATPVAASSSPPPKSASEAQSKPPDWVTARNVQFGEQKLIVVSGELAAAPEAAEEAALDSAVQLVASDLAAHAREIDRWRPAAPLVREAAVRRVYIEQIHRQTMSSGTPFRVYRAFEQVELSAAVRKQLSSAWQAEVVERRIWSLGGLAGLLTLTFGAAAAYFRLDDRTAGRYRVRLKLAAVSVIAAGGFVAAILL